jgi:hypothetical protein
MTLNITLAIGVYFLLPETKNVALEDMDTLFGGVSHVDQGAAIVEKNGEDLDVTKADYAHAVITENIESVESKKETV